MTEHDLEIQLRASLAARAADAPDDHAVVQQVFRDVDAHATSPRPTHPSRWRNWTIPVVAAGAVAAAAVIVVAVQNVHTSGHHGAPVATHAGPTSAPVTNPAPSGSVSATTPATPSTAVGTRPGVTHFQATDLSFVGTEAWALGTADCTTGPGSGCAALLHSTNSGVTWQVINNPPANVPQAGTCNDPCVRNIRFATDKIGYAYGLNVFFMTTDGGTTWQSQPGGALALETLDGNVIRVDTGCLPGCPVTVETAPIASVSWTKRALPGTMPSDGASLERVASNAYLIFYGHVAGGAQNATSVLFVSHDDGATWVNNGEPCPADASHAAAGGEVDSTAIAAAPNTFAVLCTSRGTVVAHVLTSSGTGNYRTGSASLSAAELLAASGQVLLADTSTGLYRSTDRGDSWQQVNEPMLGAARWLGFETTTDARVIDSTGTTVWTTHNAGASWTSLKLP